MESADAGPPDGRDAGTDWLEVMPHAPSPPRLIAPLSTATVTSRRPTLRWILAAGTDGAHVQICRDRACTIEVASFDADGNGMAPAEILPAGVFFWRAYGRTGGATGTKPSPVWQMTVGARGAPVDTSWGTTLDVNGDGFADVVVGAYYADNIGRAYVYLGGAAGLATSPAMTLTSPGGFIGGAFGISVASAGDVNGDGYADVIVGASQVSYGESEAGAAYLYLGGAAGLATSPAATLIGPDQSRGFFGVSVASAGDVDGDGYADVIVGAGGTGAAYLYLGSAEGLASSPATTLRAPAGTRGLFGAAVAGAGDVNGDGFADVIIGAYTAGDDGAGAAYLYLGSAEGLASSPSANLTGPDGAGGQFGSAVAGAGDVDGDGYADVIIGAYGADDWAGRAYLYVGSAAGLAASPAASLLGPDGADGAFGFVAGAGDINGDGFADVVVGADAASAGAGRAYVYLGGGAGLSSSPATALASPGGGSFGVAVAGAGDVDGDGYSDVIIGAYTAGGELTGQAYVYLGGTVGIVSSPTATLNGPDGANGSFGISVATAGEPRAAYVQGSRSIAASVVGFSSSI